MAGTAAARGKNEGIERAMEIVARLMDADEALDDVIREATALRESFPRLKYIAVAQIGTNLTAALDEQIAG